MKKITIGFAVTTLLLFSASACSYGQSRTVNTQIERINSIYFTLFAKKDLSIVDLYARDGALLPPNAPAVRGRTQLLKDFKNAYADVNIKGVRFTTKSIYSYGENSVAEEGAWQVIGADGRVVDTGKYLKFWKKTINGWKIFRDIFNSDHKA